MTTEFLITTLIVVLLPGTGVIYTLAAGLTQGARASVLAAFASPPRGQEAVPSAQNPACSCRFAGSK